ncbi:MAG: hypothetical protein WA948_06335 [Pontixanthobacter sp.]
MIQRGSRLRQIGWAVALTICLTMFLALTFRVNAIKSDVLLAEREIIALDRQKTMLEIEFQTRASQQQLANYNRVEFGYRPPSADQYLENERQMASLGLPRGPGAPSPIRVAQAPVDDDTGTFPAMVSPLTGQSFGASEDTPKRKPGNASRSLADRLAAENPLAGGVGVEMPE